MSLFVLLAVPIARLTARRMYYILLFQCSIIRKLFNISFIKISFIKTCLFSQYLVTKTNIMKMAYKIINTHKKHKQKSVGSTLNSIKINL